MKSFSIIDSKPIYIRWNRNGSQQKSCITSYYRQFPTNIKINIIKLMPVLVARVLGLLGANETSFDQSIFHFNIREKLSVMQCNNILLKVSKCRKLSFIMMSLDCTTIECKSLILMVILLLIIRKWHSRMT